MLERFTDRGRRVLAHAQEEARLLNHDFIGTEHILIGLIREEDGVAAKALLSLGVTVEVTRARVEEIVGMSPNTPSTRPPFTPRAKKMLELSLREALQLGHSYIGTEHLLLGLVREGEGVGARVLQDLGYDLLHVRQQVLQLLSGYSTLGSPVDRQNTSEPTCTKCRSDLTEVARHRTLTVPPSSPEAAPRSVDVIYCIRCGQVLAILDAESQD